MEDNNLCESLILQTPSKLLSMTSFAFKYLNSTRGSAVDRITLAKFGEILVLFSKTNKIKLIDKYDRVNASFDYLDTFIIILLNGF